MVDNDEEVWHESQEQPAPAHNASVLAEDRLDAVVENWYSIELAGTSFADTPEKHNELRKKLENLKNALKIKE